MRGGAVSSFTGAAPLSRKGVAQKVYVVMARVRPANPGDPEVGIIDVKLTAAGAEEVIRQVPGSWLAGKFLATK